VKIDLTPWEVLTRRMTTVNNDIEARHAMSKMGTN